MAPQTAGEYEGTNYQFKMPVTVDKHYGSTVYTVKINKISINVLYYMHMEAHGSKTHSKFISNLLMNLQKHSMLKSSCQYIRRFRIKIIKRRMCFLKKLYHDLLNQVADSKQIVVMGDSAGGQIALSFAQLLKENILCNQDILY